MAISSAIKHSLSGIFNEGFFQIPNYQRKYSWEEKQNKELFNDLWEGFEAEIDHYLGTLSLYETDGLGFQTRYQIIDGQQRFTSLLILFSVLIHYDKTDDIDIDILLKTYKGEKVYILEPINGEDKEYFCAILDGKEIQKPETKSQKLMQKAQKVYLDELKIRKEQIKKQGGIRKFAFYVMKQATFLINLVKDEVAANRMFESINDRGVPLKYFDKIKSFLLYISNKNCNSELDEKITLTFNKIYQFLDQDHTLPINDDSTLLYFHFLSNSELFNGYWSYTPATPKIYNDFKEHLLINGNKSKFITDYLADIEKFIDAVNSIEKKIKTYEEYNEFFRILSPTNSMYPISIRLEILELLDDNINNLIIAGFYFKARRDPKKDIYDALQNVIENCSNEVKIAKKISKLKEQSNRYVNAMGEILKYNWAARYVLYIYSREKFDKIKFENFKETEIEHICPKNAASIKQLGWGTKELYHDEIESIGNKLLLEKKLNTKASNKDPKDKLELYSQSKFAMNHYITVKNKEGVLKREKELVKFIKEYLDR